MKFLLDTHILLWCLDEYYRIGPQTQALITDPMNDILVSVVSLWEVAIKQRAGKLQVEIEEVSATVDRIGFSLLPIRPAHLANLMRLPMHHRDPFDHMLIAQAITEQAIFISEDRHAPAYAVQTRRCIT